MCGDLLNELSYSEKLRDPRWQKKRPEILQRDDFHCRQCGDGLTTLHVHHCFYRQGFEPWDYPDESLVTLCANCHEVETLRSLASKIILSDALAMHGLLHNAFLQLATAVSKSLPLWEESVSALAWAIETPDVLSNLIEKYSEHLAGKQENDG